VVAELGWPEIVAVAGVAAGLLSLPHNSGTRKK